MLVEVYERIERCPVDQPFFNEKRFQGSHTQGRVRRDGPVSAIVFAIEVLHRGGII
jgi:hypothetical protein